MLFSGSTFSGSGFATGSVAGGDPRTLVSAAMAASGGVVVGLVAEFVTEIDISIAGGLDSPLVRIRRASASIPGIGSFAADVSVSPVMVTLDGSGGMVVALRYDPAQVRADLDAGGGVTVGMGVDRHALSEIAATGGMETLLSEFHKAAAEFEATGGPSILAGKWSTLEAVLGASGGMTVDTAYDLFGPVVTVTAKGPEPIVVTAAMQDASQLHPIMWGGLVYNWRDVELASLQAISEAVPLIVTVVEHEDIIVVSEGI